MLCREDVEVGSGTSRGEGARKGGVGIPMHRCKQGNSRNTYEDNGGGVQESTRHFSLFQSSNNWQHVKERTPHDIQIPSYGQTDRQPNKCRDLVMKGRSEISSL